MKKVQVLFALVLATTFFSACAKVPVTHFYTLEAPPAATAGKTLPFDVSVARFRTGFRLAQDRLVYMPSAYQVDYYSYHRWTGYPADLLTAALITTLKRDKTFRSVSEVKTGVNPDYILHGEIQNLEELDSANSATARVSVTLDVTDAKTHAIVWSGAAQYEKTVSSGNVDDVARELNQGVQETLEKLVRDMSAQFPAAKP